MDLKPWRSVFTKDNIQICILYCCIPAAIFYVISLTVMSQAGFTFVEILRDPAQQTKTSSFLGFVSSIGSWLWVSAAAISFFAVLTFEAPSPINHKKLLSLVGWFSLILAVDDFFLIHDRFITEGILIPLYAGFVGYLLVRHRQKIIEIDGFAFLLAGTFLALSVVVDAVQEILPMSYNSSQAFEEGFKFMGGATWLYFCARIAAYRRGVLAQTTVD